MIPNKVLCEEVWKAGCPNLPILKICHQISLSPNMLEVLASCTAVSGWVSSCNHIRPWLPRRTTTIVPSFPTKASFCNMETSTWAQNTWNLSCQTMSMMSMQLFLSPGLRFQPSQCRWRCWPRHMAWVNWVNRFDQSTTRWFKITINEIYGDWDLHLHGAVAWSQPPQGGCSTCGGIDLDKRSERRAKEPHDTKAFCRESEVVFFWNGKELE